MIEFFSGYIGLTDIALEITLGIMLMACAWLWPFRKQHARPEIIWDLIGLCCVFVFAIIYCSFEYPLYDRLSATAWLGEWQNLIGQWPVWLVLSLNIVLADFLAYWAHRLLHSRLLWATHAWHHSPGYLYWLSGLRGSFIHTVLIMLPYTMAYLLLPIAETGLAYSLMLIINSLNRLYTHSNIRLPLQHFLEMILVTPRYHFVHHSTTPEVSNSNYGFIFALWDHLFHTYTDPEKIDIDDTLGLDYEISNMRLLLGVPANKKLEPELHAETDTHSGIVSASEPIQQAASQLDNLR